LYAVIICCLCDTVSGQMVLLLLKMILFYFILIVVDAVQFFLGDKNDLTVEMDDVLIRSQQSRRFGRRSNRSVHDAHRVLETL